MDSRWCGARTGSGISNRGAEAETTIACCVFTGRKTTGSKVAAVHGKQSPEPYGICCLVHVLHLSITARPPARAYQEKALLTSTDSLP